MLPRAVALLKRRCVSCRRRGCVTTKFSGQWKGVPNAHPFYNMHSHTVYFQHAKCRLPTPCVKQLALCGPYRSSGGRCALMLLTNRLCGVNCPDIWIQSFSKFYPIQALSGLAVLFLVKKRQHGLNLSNVHRHESISWSYYIVPRDLCCISRSHVCKRRKDLVEGVMTALEAPLLFGRWQRFPWKYTKMIHQVEAVDRLVGSENLIYMFSIQNIYHPSPDEGRPLKSPVMM